MASGPTLNLDEYRGRKLTPAEARELVDRCGGLRPAARHLGVSYSTFRDWLYPAENRERAARWYAENRERACEAARDRYWNLTGLQLAARRLKERRAKALRRLAEAHRTKGEVNG